MDVNKRGIQPKWMKSQSASSEINVDPRCIGNGSTDSKKLAALWIRTANPASNAQLDRRRNDLIAFDDFDDLPAKYFAAVTTLRAWQV